VGSVHRVNNAGPKKFQLVAFQAVVEHGMLHPLGDALPSPARELAVVDRAAAEAVVKLHHAVVAGERSGQVGVVGHGELLEGRDDVVELDVVADVEAVIEDFPLAFLAGRPVQLERVEATNMMAEGELAETHNQGRAGVRRHDLP
jgi:hypothetical protein